MTRQEKDAIDNYEVFADRGSIYKFRDANDIFFDNKFALVVSNQYRATDRMVSILTSTETSRRGRDVVKVVDNNGKRYFVSCGMVTYCRRTMLGEKVGEAQNMGDVDVKIREALEL